MERIDGYAAAFLELASAEGNLDRVGDELFRIARAVETSPELRQALTDPRLPSDRKQGIVTDLLGQRALALSMSLVNLVVALGHARNFSAIADRLVELAAERKERAVAEVRAPIELDEETVRRLEEGLTEATGKRVEVRTVVDPSVLGGVIARVGDTVIDGSLRSRFDDLRERLDAAKKG